MVSLNKIFGLLLIVSLFVSIWIFKIIVVPPTYLSLILVSLIFYFKRYPRIKIHSYTKNLLFFVLIYFLYSIFISKDLISTIIYLFMWLLNLMVLNYLILNNTINEFVKVYVNILSFLSFISIIYFIFGFSETTHMYGVSLDKNFLVFVNTPAIFLSLKRGYKIRTIILFASTFLLFSRTFYVIIISYFIFTILQNISLRVLLKYLLITLFISLIFLYFLPEDSFLIKRINGGIELASAIFQTLNQGIDYKTLISTLDDKRRFLLFLSNFEILLSTFPWGTGMGLQNYLASTPDYLLGDLAYRPARAHNFYLSYAAEMGIFFIYFLYLLFKPIFNEIKKSDVPIFLSVMVALTFNEFITTPFFWMFLGILINKKYNND